jgi:hypothetical protein
MSDCKRYTVWLPLQLWLLFAISEHQGDSHMQAELQRTSAYSDQSYRTMHAVCVCVDLIILK